MKFTVIVEKFGNAKSVTVGKYETLKEAVEARFDYLKKYDKSSAFYTPTMAEAKQNLFESMVERV